MVNALILIPAIVCLIMLYFDLAPRVLLKVYLPCLMIVPLYLDGSFFGVPIDPSSFVAVILGCVGLYLNYHTLRLSLIDLCIGLNAFSVYYADAHYRPGNLSLHALAHALFSCVFPYLIGRTLIEQGGIRMSFAKVLVLCLAVVSVISVWEFRMTANLFENAVDAIANTRGGWIRQRRWGYARIAGPYGHAIIAGMVFTVGLMFQLWLWATKRWSSLDPPKAINPARKTLILTGAMALGLAMTMSRGPWIGCGLGLLVALIGLAKNRRRAAVLSLAALALYVVATSVILDKYTNLDGRRAQSQDQENAAYRRQLIDTYEPIIEQGGLWGLGSPMRLKNGTYGYVASQASIDNHYLLLGVSQGYFGVSLFVLTLLLCVGRLIWNCVRLRQREDIVFAYCMLGAVVASAFTLTTVSLSAPMIQLLYLTFGWSQSIQPTRSTAPTLRQVEAPPPYVFERVFV